MKMQLTLREMNSLPSIIPDCSNSEKCNGFTPDKNGSCFNLDCSGYVVPLIKALLRR